MLPPKEARGLILIDPSYEVKSEYQTTILTLKKALKKFAHGTYMIWYPILNQKEYHQFRADLSELAIGKSLQTELLFAPLKQTHGLEGSGLFIINPPYVLENQINGLRPYLEKKFSSAFNSID